MTVASVVSTANTTPATATPAATTAKGNSLDTAAFLKLLVAELQNQDPTKPMDSTQMVQQLSSFSQVEQATATNLKLGSILDALSIGQASGLLGRVVTSPDGTKTGVVEAVRISSSGPVARLADGSEIQLAPGVTVGS
jgi:flagellar basal-body rod modification protein FlgD